MAPRIPRTRSEINPRQIQLSFSEGLQECFHELAEIAKTSTHFSPEIISILRDWGGGRVTSVNDVLIAMPSIAEQVAEHLIATNDRTVREIWRGIASLFPEEGFILSASRQRAL